MVVNPSDSLYTWLIDSSAIAFGRRDYTTAQQALASAFYLAQASYDAEAINEVAQLGTDQQAWLIQHDLLEPGALYSRVLDQARRRQAAATPSFMTLP